MSPAKIPVTPAIRVLREHGVSFTCHSYTYEERGGTPVAARELGVDEHAIVKTIVMEDDTGSPLIVLMHGDREVSTKNLARHIGVKTIRACRSDVAKKHSGYVVGGTSPFGTRKVIPIYMERTILDVPTIYINGGRRGFQLAMKPKDVVAILQPELVDVGI
jgi:Cys-tRNA(Pro) deacylase